MIHNYKKLDIKTFKKYVTYGLNPKADYKIKNIKYEKEKTKFDLIIRNLNGKKKTIKNIILKLNGEYNQKCDCSYLDMFKSRSNNKRYQKSL